MVKYRPRRSNSMLDRFPLGDGCLASFSGANCLQRYSSNALISFFSRNLITLVKGLKSILRTIWCDNLAFKNSAIWIRPGSIVQRFSWTCKINKAIFVLVLSRENACLTNLRHSSRAPHSLRKVPLKK